MKPIHNKAYIPRGNRAIIKKTQLSSYTMWVQSRPHTEEGVL